MLVFLFLVMLVSFFFFFLEIKINAVHRVCLCVQNQVIL